MQDTPAQPAPRTLLDIAVDLARWATTDAREQAEQQRNEAHTRLRAVAQSDEPRVTVGDVLRRIADLAEGALSTARSMAPRRAPRDPASARRHNRERTGRRSTARRRTGASSRTSSADPGDDGPGEPPPPPRLLLWRHPRFGSATPNLLRQVVRAQGEEAKR